MEWGYNSWTILFQCELWIQKIVEFKTFLTPEYSETFILNILYLFTSYSKTSAQILLRWSLQQGYSVIPKSLDPEHIRQNRELDIVMADSDVEKINALYR